jgi:hypothetical protein
MNVNERLIEAVCQDWLREVPEINLEKFGDNVRRSKCREINVVPSLQSHFQILHICDRSRDSEDSLQRRSCDVLTLLIT